MMFERFDQVDARFAKLFAAGVLCLVAALIVVDIVGAAFRDKSPPSAGVSVKEVPKAPECRVMPSGTQICDAVPPRQGK